VKLLNGSGLHTKLGMIGYCRKNHKAPNFNSWAKNVTEEMQKKGDDLYLVLGKGDLKGRCELTENNIMSKADMFRRFKMKRGFPSFMATVLRMMRSGRYFFSTRFVIESRGLSEPRLESLWRTIILPKNVVQGDITNILFPSENTRFDPSRYENCCRSVSSLSFCRSVVWASVCFGLLV